MRRSEAGQSSSVDARAPTQAVSANEPASRSPCVIVCVPVQVIDAPGARSDPAAGLQVKLSSGGVSVTTTLWAVLKVPLLVTAMVKLWLPSPAVTVDGLKVLRTERVTSEVMVRLAVLDAVGLTSSLLAEPVLGTEAGTVFLERAYRIVALSTRAVERTRLASDGEIGHLSVGYYDPAILNGIPELIRGFLDQNGIHVEPTQLAIWAIPTAVCALIIHCTRLLLLDRKLRAEIESKSADA